jgi:putative phage-type endonuclease
MIRKIGGSLTAKICGVSDWGSPWGAWRSLVDGWQPETNLAMRVGKELEKSLLPELYRERLPKGADLYPSQEIEVGEWARAHLDGVVVIAGERRVVEYKTASIRTTAKWGNAEDSIPSDYLLQVQFYMWATGYEKADVAVLLGNEDFQVRTIHRDEGLIGRMIAECERFWFEHVVPQRPPEIDGSKACAEWIRERYPEPKGPDGMWLEPDKSLSDVAAKYRALSAESERLNAEAKAIRNVVAEAIGSERGIKGIARKDKRGVVTMFKDGE